MHVYVRFAMLIRARSWLCSDRFLSLSPCVLLSLPLLGPSLFPRRFVNAYYIHMHLIYSYYWPPVSSPHTHLDPFRISCLRSLFSSFVPFSHHASFAVQLLPPPSPPPRLQGSSRYYPVYCRILSRSFSRFVVIPTRSLLSRSCNRVLVSSQTKLEIIAFFFIVRVWVCLS